MYRIWCTWLAYHHICPLWESPPTRKRYEDHNPSMSTYDSSYIWPSYTWSQPTTNFLQNLDLTSSVSILLYSYWYHAQLANAKSSVPCCMYKRIHFEIPTIRATTIRESTPSPLYLKLMSVFHWVHGTLCLSTFLTGAAGMHQQPTHPTTPPLFF